MRLFASQSVSAVRLTAGLAVVSALALWLGSTGLIFAEQKPRKTSEQPSSNDSRDSDEAAVHAAMQTFAKTFASRDAKALAALWTVEGEYENERTGLIRGRSNLEAIFAKLFSRAPEVRVEMHPESLRFLSRDTAIEDGTVRVYLSNSDSMSSAHYSAFFVREDGRWLLAQLHESPDERVDISDLAWLAGEWTSTGQNGVEIRSTYTLPPQSKFMQVRFHLKEGSLDLHGSQVIGVDPATGNLHTWSFESDGGVAESTWNIDGDHWVLDVVGTLSDGRTLTQRNIVHRVNDDTFTLQSIDRFLGDEALPDLPPIKVSRVKAEK